MTERAGFDAPAARRPETRDAGFAFWPGRE